MAGQQERRKRPVLRGWALSHPPPELVRLTHDPPAGYALPSWKLSKGISRSPPRYPGKKEGGVQEAGSAGRGKGHLKEGDKLPGLT